MNLLSAILYTFSAIVISMLVASYSIAFRMKPRLPVLAFIFFFVAVLIITIVTVIKLWGIVLFGNHIPIPVTTIRPTLLFLSSGFLLYTTWRKNIIV